MYAGFVRKSYKKGYVTAENRDHINRKYQGAARQGCNLNLILTKKLYIVSNLCKIYHEVEKYNFKISFISKAVEKYMSFTIEKCKKN